MVDNQTLFATGQLNGSVNTENATGKAIQAAGALLRLNLGDANLANSFNTQGFTEKTILSTSSRKGPPAMDRLLKSGHQALADAKQGVTIEGNIFSVAPMDTPGHSAPTVSLSGKGGRS